MKPAVRLFVMFLLAVLLGLPKPVNAAPRTSATSTAEEICTGNLAHIYRVVVAHRHRSQGMVPFDTQALRLMVKDPTVLRCPADKDSSMRGRRSLSYEVVNDPSGPYAVPEKTVAIVVESRPNHDGKRFVLFLDGSIAQMARDQFDRLKSRGFIRSDQ